MTGIDTDVIGRGLKELSDERCRQPAAHRGERRRSEATRLKALARRLRGYMSAMKRID